MNPACHICGTLANFLMKKDGFDEYLCPVCGFSFISPLPKAEWLKEKVYSAESGYQGNKKSDLSLAAEPSRMTKILDGIAASKSKGKLLDVGCSSGQFMFWAKKRGMVCKGIEINSRTADIAIKNGFDVFKGFLEDAPFEKESFDVIYAGDVIEHVTDPRAFMKTCGEFLKEDGLLVVSTPNTECFWSAVTLGLYKYFGIPWAVATPPHHLSQFGYTNLNRLLSEQKFEVVDSLFTKPSSLKYEFGSLHLYGKYKKHKTVGNFLFMLFSYAMYTIVYGINMILSPFLSHNFQMVTFYER